jgi:hypothetical protein
MRIRSARTIRTTVYPGFVVRRPGALVALSVALVIGIANSESHAESGGTGTEAVSDTTPVLSAGRFLEASLERLRRVRSASLGAAVNAREKVTDNGTVGRARINPLADVGAPLAALERFLSLARAQQVDARRSVSLPVRDHPVLGTGTVHLAEGDGHMRATYRLALPSGNGATVSATTRGDRLVKTRLDAGRFIVVRRPPREASSAARPPLRVQARKAPGSRNSAGALR